MPNSPGNDRSPLDSSLEERAFVTEGVVHDLKNILGVIQGNLELARLLVGGESEAHSHLSHAEKAVLRAARLTHSLLDFRADGSLPERELSLREIVDDCLASILPMGRYPFQLEVGDGLRMVYGSEVKVSLIFSNLIFNSVQAMPDGGELMVRLYMEESGEDSAVVCELSDSGSGIPEAEQEQVFTRAFSSRKGNGWGLGLPTVKELVEELGGEVTFTSRLGCGTTFRIRFPTVDRFDVFDAVKEEPVFPDAVLESRGCVLVVDDEPLVQETLGDLLAFLSFSSKTASDGETALRLFREARESGEPFVLSIIDISLIGPLSGLDVIREMKGMDPEMKAVVTSGHANDPAMLSCKAHGFEGRIFKPYSLSDLQAVIDAVLAEA